MTTDFGFASFAVAFVDILGQRDKLRTLEDFPLTEEQRERILQTLQDTLGMTLDLRRGYRDYLLAASRPSAIRKALPPQQEAIFEAASRSEITFRYFSDSIVLSVCLANTNANCTPINGILSVLLGTATMQVAALELGHPIRGGIDVGLAAELEDGEVYGAALERAYTLESKVAGYPRVVIGYELRSYVHLAATQSAASLEGRVARSLAQWCERLIFADTDGCFALDFLGDEVRRCSMGGVRLESLEALSGFVETELARFSAAGDEKLAERYRKLWTYIKSRLPKWRE